MTTTKEVLIAGGLLLAALIAGWITQALGWCLFIATVIWIAIQITEIRKVRGWAERPLSTPKNGLESWFELAYQPYRSLIRQRQRTQRMAGRLREVLRLAEVIPDGVIVVTPSGDIEDLNQAAKQLLMLKDSDIGLGLSTVVRNPEFVEFIRLESYDSPLEFISPTDPELTYEARRFAMDNGRAVIIVRDITTLNRLLTMRQNFVANVSHELRTPLTVMSGYMETISDESQPVELRLGLTERIAWPIKRMGSLVDDLLLLSRLESMAIPEQKDHIMVTALINAAAAEVQGLCDNPQQLKVHCRTDRAVEGIEAEIHSALTNLLGNAVRYSPNGETVELVCEDVGEQIRFSVIDHGIGIAPEHLTRITERFYRVDMATARSTGGTGLGLAIVKHVLRRHNTVLFVESKLGAGSVFSFEIDAAPARFPTD